MMIVLLQEYSTALRYVRTFLQIEPGNQQVQKLETLIKKKMEKGLYFCRNWYFYLCNALSLRLWEVKECMGAGLFTGKKVFFCHQDAICIQAMVSVYYWGIVGHNQKWHKPVICQEKPKLCNTWKYKIIRPESSLSLQTSFRAFS